MTRPRRLGTRIPTSTVVCLTLAGVTLAAYRSVVFHEFVVYDDQVYVTDNPQVQAGLGWNGMLWAFRGVVASNWHPVTLLSHMLDCQLFGLRPGWHHATSLALHVLNALLLFRILERTTRATWRSAFVAGLFAWHPLHVESVAWIAERKDVLSTFFGLLSTWAYVRYTAGSTRFYVLSVVFFVLGLLSKPMLVTLPFAFLLLDYWPLQRPTFALVEKLPFFALSTASCVVTFFVQKRAGAMVLMESVPLTSRMANALVSYCRYILKALWPVDLAAFYPFRGWPTATVVGAGIFLAAATVLVVRHSRRRRYLAVGWFWFVGMLVPVIGVVQVGTQAMADRYTYLPLVGLFIMVAWGGAELLAAAFPGERSGLRSPGGWLAGAALAACAVLTSIQCGYWRDTATLFAHALAVTSDNSLAEYGLGRALFLRGDLDGALRHYSNAVKIQPDYVDALSDLGSVLTMKGDAPAGIRRYREALRLAPNNAALHCNLGEALESNGQLEEAIAEETAAVQLDPGLVDAHRNLARLLARSDGDSPRKPAP